MEGGRGFHPEKKFSNARRCSGLAWLQVLGIDSPSATTPRNLPCTACSRLMRSFSALHDVETRQCSQRHCFRTSGAPSFMQTTHCSCSMATEKSQCARMQRSNALAVAVAGGAARAGAAIRGGAGGVILHRLDLLRHVLQQRVHPVSKVPPRHVIVRVNGIVVWCGALQHHSISPHPRRTAHRRSHANITSLSHLMVGPGQQRGEHAA